MPRRAVPSGRVLALVLLAVTLAALAPLVLRLPRLGPKSTLRRSRATQRQPAVRALGAAAEGPRGEARDAANAAAALSAHCYSHRNSGRVVIVQRAANFSRELVEGHIAIRPWASDCLDQSELGTPPGRVQQAADFWRLPAAAKELGNFAGALRRTLQLNESLADSDMRTVTRLRRAIEQDRFEDAARTLSLFLQAEEAWPADATLFDAVVFDDGAVLGHTVHRNLSATKRAGAQGKEEEGDLQHRVLLVPKGCRPQGAGSADEVHGHAPQTNESGCAGESDHAQSHQHDHAQSHQHPAWAARCLCMYTMMYAMCI